MVQDAGCRLRARGDLEQGLQDLRAVGQRFRFQQRLFFVRFCKGADDA